MILEDGTSFLGTVFGSERAAAGEVVFTTGMVGYPESLTDPSYAGQILVATYPLVGNYGVPGDERDALGLPVGFESERVQVRAFVVSTLASDTSHRTARRSLDGWLRESGVAGLHGVDTRALAKRLRDQGTMLGKVVVDGVDPEIDESDPNLTNLVATVSIPEPVHYGQDGPRIVLVDTGSSRASSAAWSVPARA